MVTVRQGIIGVVSVVFLLGGVTLVTPFGSEAEAAPPAGPFADQNTEMTAQHDEIKGVIGTAQTTIQGTVQTESTTVQTAIGAHGSEMTTQHDMIKQDLTDVETNLEGKIQEVKDLVEALEGGGVAPLCGAGTEGQRFVPDDPTTPTEYCDNITGLSWVKTPDSTTRNHATAITHCATLDLGNSQTYRLPEVQELSSLVDYSQFNPTLPSGHPFMNVQSDLYWSATTSAFGPAFAWHVNFLIGNVDDDLKTFTLFVWCARSGS